MSARATRPRSRRGRHPLPGELDPVAESSEEVDANNGRFETKPELHQEYLGPDLQSPRNWIKEGCDVGSHVVLSLSLEEQCKPEVEAHQVLQEAPLDPGPAEISVPSVYETLQCRLSSLEAVVAALRHHSSLSFPKSVEAEDRDQGAPGPFGDEKEDAGSGQQEAARLIERNAWLRLALCNREDELACTQASLQDAQAEKETLQRQVQELEDSLMQMEASPPPPILRAGRRNSSSSTSGAERRPWGPQDSPMAHPFLQRLRSDSSTQSFGCLSTQHPAPETYLMEDQMGQLQGSEGSGVDKPTPEELAAQLHGYVQHLRERWALVKIPEALGPVTAPKATMPHAEATVQAILEIQPGPALPHLEKSQIQQDLAATRDSLADLVLRLQLTQREKRGLELREAALRAQGPAHQLLLQQLRWERAHFAGDGSSGGSSEDPSSEEEAGEDRQQHYQGPPALLDGQMGKVWDSENVSQELSASLARAIDLRAQLQSLRRQLEQMAQKGRTRRVQSAELSRELCKAHSALALAFRGAQRKQEEQRRKLEQQVARLQAQQAEELAVLTATARALGKPGAPQPAQTFL
ncbi:Usher syndrome type-1C protein-binding protein 1 isoform X2 [Mus caroli]|uniref:Usher syndrome type-1C protein-binding protein 1 isoform X2 n=1 Tax=Mus caroli TaxID=10089 RepID=A0A6P7RIU6_MUSCR|nr:Usher syndrome type-1C protein-binding protein 1 isoform X2 [Mus caroli]